MSEMSLKNQYGYSPDIISNIHTSPLTHDQEKDELIIATVDLACSADNLPITDSTVGAVFISCLPGALRNRSTTPMDSNLRDNALIEAARVTRPGGKIIYHGGTQADVTKLLELGFTAEYAQLQLCSRKTRGTLLGLPRNKRYTFPDLSIHGVYTRSQS